MDEHPLWHYFREVSRAVSRTNRKGGEHLYASGHFMVSALADDIELSVTDISEEDAILIASELKAMGVHAVIRSSLVCPRCGQRVPAQTHCVNCRHKLSSER